MNYLTTEEALAFLKLQDTEETRSRLNSARYKKKLEKRKKPQRKTAL